MERKKILSLTVEVGNGHKNQAMAIGDAIKQQHPEIEIVTLDMFKDLGSHRLDALYKNTWRRALKWPSTLLKAAYLPWKSRFLTHGFERVAGIACIRRLLQQVKKINPDLIISTHFTPTHYLSVLKRRGLLDVPVVVVHSEPYDTFASWQHHSVDSYICFSNLIKREILRTCQCKDVSVFNFPLNPRFSHPQEDQDVLREKLGLSVSDLTLLATCGGEGVGLQEAFLHRLFQSGLPWQVVVVCGRNEALKKRLEKTKLPAGSKCKLKVLGFVKNMNEYIAASDVVLGKAGPATTFESLVLGRPVIQTRFMPQERGVMRYVTQKRLGWYAPSPDKFLQIMREITQNPKILRECRERIMEEGLKNGSREIADYIISLLKKGEETHSA